MANIVEVSNFDANVYLIDISDPATGGLTGIANKQAIALANRTRWLYDELTPLLDLAFLAYTNGSVLVIGNNTIVRAIDGVAHAVPTTGSPDFTTPNDGITHTYRITISFFTDHTYNAAGNVGATLLDISNANSPAVVIVALTRQPYQTVTMVRTVSIAPNKPLRWVIQNTATGANASVQSINAIFEQL